MAGLLAAQFGCAEIPPLPVDRSLPNVAATAPPAGAGQVVVDAEPREHARLEEIVGRANVRSTETIPTVIGGTWLAIPYTQTKVVDVTRERCSALPCVVNAPLGQPLELAVASGGVTQAFRVPIEPERTYVRLRLPEERRPALGVLGWVLAGVSLAPITAGSTLLGLDSSLIAPGIASLVGGLALGALGLVLALTHPITHRQGSIAAWAVR